MSSYENSHCPNCNSIQRIEVEYDPTGTHGPRYTCTNCDQNINLSTRILKGIWSGVSTLWSAACKIKNWYGQQVAEAQYKEGVKDFVNGRERNAFMGDSYQQGWSDAKKQFPGPR